MMNALNRLSKASLRQSIRWRLWKYQRNIRQSFIIKLQDRIKMRLYSDDKLSELIYLHDFEYKERMFLNRFLKRGDIFVDIGANIGLFTLIGSALVGVEGKTIAFEPCSKNYMRLLDNIKLNGYSNVVCNKIALSDIDGEAYLTVSKDGFDAWNSLAKPSAGVLFDKELVRTVRWDEYVLENNLTGLVALMKVDVEGWEYNVLQGSKRMLQRDDAPVLLVEFTDENALNAGHTCQQVFKVLSSLGYEIFSYDSVNNVLIEELVRAEYPYINLIAAKNRDYVIDRLSTKR